MKLFDSHSHWLPEQIINNAHFFSKAWGDIEAQLKAMDGAGIEQAILSYPTTDAHVKLGSLKEVAHIYNHNVSLILKKFPKQFVGAAILPVGDKDAMLSEFKRATTELGFKALSLATSYNGVYLDDAQFLPLFAEAERLSVPIFVHSQIVSPIGTERVQDPLLTPVIEYVFDTTICIGKLLMSGILKDFPGLTFIFGYFGGVTPFLKDRYNATYQMLRGINFVKDLGSLPSDYLKKIYVDTGGDRTLANFMASLELFGADHILWGSDYPAKKDIQGSIDTINSLAISQKVKENILGKNLSRIIGEVKV